MYTIVIDNWRPEICAITLPNLRRYAERIGADFKVITQARFPGYPPNYERLQIWEDGRDYEWNICIDADTIIHPLCDDPTTNLRLDQCGALWILTAKYYFAWNEYFERDGRNIGFADWFVVSSWLTHDLWQPLTDSFEEAQKNCLREPRQVSEFCLSQNIAKFGLHTAPLVRDYMKIFSPSVTTNKISDADAVQLFKDKLIEWGELLP